MLEPSSIEALAAIVAARSRLAVVGSSTKPRLIPDGFERLSTRRLSGMLEYDPGEFTFTALAGTPVRQIVATLARENQYLPFDPPWVDAGSTLGGMVAGGVNGPGRFRYGGIRDFILGVRFVDGSGRIQKMGGKVVKNAAGFDVPKFLTGSLGRFSALAEITFKVFPLPKSTGTIRIRCDSPPDVERLLPELGRSRFDFDALDIHPADHAMLGRLRAPEEAMESLLRSAAEKWKAEILSRDLASNLWRDLTEFRWAPPETRLLKTPITLRHVAASLEFVRRHPSCRVHLSAGGNVAFFAIPKSFPMEEFNRFLATHSLSAMTLRGRGPLWLGRSRALALDHRLKSAFDPHSIFPELDA